MSIFQVISPPVTGILKDVCTLAFAQISTGLTHGHHAPVQLQPAAPLPRGNLSHCHATATRHAECHHTMRRAPATRVALHSVRQQRRICHVEWIGDMPFFSGPKADPPLLHSIVATSPMALGYAAIRCLSHDANQESFKGHLRSVRWPRQPKVTSRFQPSWKSELHE